MHTPIMFNGWSWQKNNTCLKALLRCVCVHMWRDGTKTENRKGEGDRQHEEDKERQCDKQQLLQAALQWISTLQSVSQAHIIYYTKLHTTHTQHIKHTQKCKHMCCPLLLSRQHCAPPSLPADFIRLEEGRRRWGGGGNGEENVRQGEQDRKKEGEKQKQCRWK